MLKPSLKPKLPLSRSRSKGPLNPWASPKTMTSCHLGQRTFTTWQDSSSPGPMQKQSLLQSPEAQPQPGSHSSPQQGAPHGQPHSGPQLSPQPFGPQVQLPFSQPPPWP